MTKTRTEIVNLAFQHLGINASGEIADATEYNYADSVFDGLVAELASVQGVTVPADLDLTPDDLFLPFSHLLAAEIAPHYEVRSPLSRSTAIGRVRAYLLPDDRELGADYDDSGTVTAAEQEIRDRAAFY